MVSELRLTDSGEGTHVQTLRRTARLIGWSVMYCLLDYCLIALIMIELLDMHDKRNIWLLIFDYAYDYAYDYASDYA